MRRGRERLGAKENRAQLISQVLGSDLQSLARLGNLLLFERLSGEQAGDHESAGQHDQRGERHLPSDGESHAVRSASFNLYPNDLTEVMASFRSGIFCFRRRICTST